MDVTALDSHPRAEGLKTLQVQIDWPRADDAAARQRHGGLLQTAEQRSHDTDRTTHFPDQIIVTRAFDFFGPDADGVTLGTDLCAKPGENLRHELDIAEVGHAPDDARFSRQQRSGQDRQHGVLGAADGDFAVQRDAAFYHQAFHRVSVILSFQNDDSGAVSVILLNGFDNPVFAFNNLTDWLGLAVAEF